MTTARALALGWLPILVLACSTSANEETGSAVQGVVCAPAMKRFPVRAAHKIGYDHASCGTGTCEPNNGDVSTPNKEPFLAFYGLGEKMGWADMPPDKPTPSFVLERNQPR